MICQPILDCFILKFKLKYDDLKNIKTDHVNTFVFNLHQIKQLKFFWDTQYGYESDERWLCPDCNEKDDLKKDFCSTFQAEINI